MTRFAVLSTHLHISYFMYKNKTVQYMYWSHSYLISQEYLPVSAVHFLNDGFCLEFVVGLSSYKASYKKYAILDFSGVCTDNKMTRVTPIYWEMSEGIFVTGK